jgi:hypothetical protein
MKRFTQIATAVALIGVGGLIGGQVLAHGTGMGQGPGYGMGSGMMMGHGPGQMPMAGVQNQAWFNALKDKLAITADQDAAWTAYVEAASGAMEDMIDTHDQMDPDALNQLSPDDLRSYMQGMHEQRLDQMIAVVEARNALFKVLDEKQTRIAKATLRNSGMGMGTAMMGEGFGPCSNGDKIDP